MNKQKFAALTEKLTNVINNELFLSLEQKEQLTDELFSINQRVQAGLMKGVETRLHMVRNTFLQWRRESPLLALTRQFGHCSA